MSGKPVVPPLEVFVNDHHGILELGTAHGAGNGYVGVFFVASPYFEAFAVETLPTDFAGGVALSVHVFVADWTHAVLLKNGKVLLLTGDCLWLGLKLVLIRSLLLLFCEFELDKSL